MAPGVAREAMDADTIGLGLEPGQHRRGGIAERNEAVQPGSETGDLETDAAQRLLEMGATAGVLAALTADVTLVLAGPDEVGESQLVQHRRAARERFGRVDDRTHEVGRQHEPPEPEDLDAEPDPALRSLSLARYGMAEELVAEAIARLARTRVAVG